MKHIKKFVKGIPKRSNISAKEYIEQIANYFLKIPVCCCTRAVQQCVDTAYETISKQDDEIRENCLEDIRSLPLYSIIKDLSLKHCVDGTHIEATTLSVLISVPSVFPETASLFPVDHRKMPNLSREIRALRRQLTLTCSFGENASCGSSSCEDELDAKSAYV